MTKYFVIAAIVCSVVSCVNDPTRSQELGWKTDTGSSSATETGTSTGN